MTEDNLTLANQLCFSTYHASRLLIKLYQQALQPFALTYPQYLVLLVLWENDRLPLHELGDRLDFGSNTLTPLLKRMEINGWLTREPLISDRRQLIITLTPMALRTKPQIFAAVRELVAHRSFDQEQYQAALQVNQHLVEKLQRLLP
ncbi:MarR family winged helix-turn-helix transcriptional regulator [Levilactobacillus yiduensis]|uniref:MarR family winged helix-turn-helix transcriptional regulator n=1 Tax=Levilactobacillus yiduensis TaxID=2953880 RepID=UPI000EF2D639|nr:MarR family transcriptional regulator [Levilactobacillus yiduensis]AYM02686.1 MarR family transcriptional regulator [Levilactobacillus brevis]